MYWYNNEMPAQQGWICPKCGRVNAPWLSCCMCNVPTVSWTADTTAPNEGKNEPKEKGAGD